MAIAHVNPGAALASSTVNGLIDGVNTTALQGVVPTVTAPSSGSVVVSQNGSITFTNASTVNVNNCFTTTWANYRVVLNVSTRSTAQTINIRFRSAGADVTTATYGWIRQQVSGTTSSVSTATAGTAAPLDVGIAVGQTSDANFDVYGPADGGYTTLAGTTMAWGSAAPYLISIAVQNSTTTPFDGFSLYPSTGTWTFTGMLRIYGYNNLV